MTNKEIGNRIKNRRKELGFTLQEIADKVGVASSTIQRYESGAISQYKLPVLESIAKAINVNPAWLSREDAQMETGTSNNIVIKEKALSEQDALFSYFNKLNALGKDEAIKRVSELAEINKYITIIENNVNHLNLVEKKEEYNFAAHDDGLDKETAKRTLDKAKAIFKQMDEE